LVFFCDVGGTYFLPRLPDHVGLYLGITGNRLKGPELLEAGIATHFVPEASMADLEGELLKITGPPNKKIVEHVINKYSQPAPPDSKFSEIREDIRNYFSHDSVQSIQKALVEGNTEWSTATAAKLAKMCPMSMCVAFKQVQVGANLSLAECLQLEYLIAQGLVMRKDFYEGVRSVLLDRDNNPKWEPNEVSLVIDGSVEEIFGVGKKQKLVLDSHKLQSSL